MEEGIEVLEMSNREIKESLIAIDRSMTIEGKLNMMPRVVKSIMKSRLRDFVWMNPPIFLGSKVNEDSQRFYDGV